MIHQSSLFDSYDAEDVAGGCRGGEPDAVAIAVHTILSSAAVVNLVVDDIGVLVHDLADRQDNGSEALLPVSHVVAEVDLHVAEIIEVTGHRDALRGTARVVVKDVAHPPLKLADDGFQLGRAHRLVSRHHATTVPLALSREATPPRCNNLAHRNLLTGIPSRT